jgi:hypothetical protein
MNTAENISTTGSLSCGNLVIPSAYTNTWPRAALTQQDGKVYDLRLEDFLVFDSGQPLPAASANDDLGLVNGAFGTAANSLQTMDAKASNKTCYGRITFTRPPEYTDGETVQLRLSCGMVTTVSDSSATVDVEAHEVADDGTVGADICTTAAASINSLTSANKTFTINPAGLVAGDKLDIRVTIAITDSASGTAVIGCITKAVMLLDVKG